jgi:hypothetical protein
MQTFIRRLLEAGTLIFGSVLAIFVIVTATLFFGIKGMTVLVIAFILFVGCLGYLQTIYARERYRMQTLSNAQPLNTSTLQNDT